MKHFYKYLFLFVFSILFLNLNSQNNIHFSQFYNTPMYLNPALTGQFDDLYRFNGLSRQQWSGIGGDGSYLYQTKYASLDFSIFRKQLGVGIALLNDVSGGGIFNTMKFMPSLSYGLIMGDNMLSIGAQPLIELASLDQSKLTTQNPESFNKSVSYFDLNTGINYKHDFGFFESNLGLSFFNLIQAKESFAKTGTPEKVPMTIKANLNLDWEIFDNFKAQPGLFFAMQSLSKDVLFGSNFLLKMSSMGTKGMWLIGGLWGRTNTNNFESLIPKFGLQMNKMQVMFSYDYNTTFSKGGTSNFIDGLTNTFEISVIMTGRPKSLIPLKEDIFLLNPRF